MKIVFVLITTFFLSCTNRKGPESKLNQNDSTEQILGYSSDDEKMNQAIVEAGKTFPEFQELLKKGCKTCESFSVKLRFEGGDQAEHIWVNELHFRRNRLFGLISNEPAQSIGVKFGDTVEVKNSNLSDWMYIKEGILFGGYTVKVIYDDLSADEKREMEEQMGAKVR